ncbi:MAG TPA: hypothetical protein VFQ41_07420 [Candidatus Angelobacter sp.]|nr:hypothetical protein [Candidatus Angelobacter sp.]
MKRTFVSTLLTLTMLAPLALTAQTTVFKFHQDGEFASLNQSTDPNNSFSLTVSRNFATAAGESASLTYTGFSFAADFSSVTVTQIVGTIPSTDFTGQNTQNLALNFDVSQLDPATSFSQACTVDLFSFTLTCGPIPPGTIQLSFRENGAQRTRVLALGEEITTGNFTTRIHQRSDNSTANVTGTVFGVTATGAATVGVNHSSTLEFVRN